LLSKSAREKPARPTGRRCAKRFKESPELLASTGAVRPTGAVPSRCVRRRTAPLSSGQKWSLWDGRRKKKFRRPVGRKPLKSRESGSEMEEKGRREGLFGPVFRAFSVSAGARRVLEGILGAVPDAPIVMAEDARRLRRQTLAPFASLRRSYAARKWRCNPLKSSDSRPDMIWRRTLRTHKVWGRASRRPLRALLSMREQPPGRLLALRGARLRPTAPPSGPAGRPRPPPGARPLRPTGPRRARTARLARRA